MHRQSVSDNSISNLHKRLRIVNPASVAVERINFLFRQNGFYPLFSPSLETATGINNKKVHFDREDIKRVDNSNYPLMLYNRTPLVKSQRISGERTFDIVGPHNSLVTYTHGEFTLRTAAIFNSMEQLEEFETSYLICGINSESLNIDATLPPVGILESLSPEDRSFILDLEWKDPSDLQIERNNGRYEFTVGNTITILTTYFNISDPDTIRLLSSIELNFYWDEELKNKESEWEAAESDPLHVTYINDSDGEKTVYPYVNEIDPEYKKTDFEKSDIKLIGYNPNSRVKEELDPDDLKFGASISEVDYSYNLNSDKYSEGVNLKTVDGKIISDVGSKYESRFGRDYVNVNKKIGYSLSVNDRYSDSPSTVEKNLIPKYPIFYGIIDDPSNVNKKIKKDLRENNSYWANSISLSYGTSGEGYFYYAFPSSFGLVSSVISIPSEEKLAFKSLPVLSLPIISGKKTPRTLIDYNIIVTKDRIENPISILVK